MGNAPGVGIQASPAAPKSEPVPFSDAALVRAARLGDHDAFALIVSEHGPAMHRFAARTLGNAFDAQEAVQEAFASAWRDLRLFRGDSSLRTWLFTLVSRKAADLRRRRRPIPVDDEMLLRWAASESSGPYEHVAAAALVTALEEALTELPVRQRAAWVLREVEQMSYEEIATVLGVTVGSVRGHLHRSRNALQERMSPWR